MLELVRMLLLAVVQGLTEFLPVSSSGHLVLTQTFLATREGDVFFDVVLHLGTLGSVLVAYRGEVGWLLRMDAAARRYVVALAVGTVPAVLVGLVLKDTIEGLFHDPVFAAGGLFVTAALLFSTRTLRRTAPTTETPTPPDLRRSFLIGCGQALAILPGISRSGTTITASLWLGVPRVEAARFSFLLSIPAILGATVLQARDLAGVPGDWPQLLLAALAAFAVGLLALRWTALAVVQAHFWKFSVYCVVAGTVALLVLRAAG